MTLSGAESPAERSAGHAASSEARLRDLVGSRWRAPPARNRGRGGAETDAQCSAGHDGAPRRTPGRLRAGRGANAQRRKRDRSRTTAVSQNEAAPASMHRRGARVLKSWYTRQQEDRVREFAETPAAGQQSASASASTYGGQNVKRRASGVRTFHRRRHVRSVGKRMCGERGKWRVRGRRSNVSVRHTRAQQVTRHEVGRPEHAQVARRDTGELARGGEAAQSGTGVRGDYGVTTYRERDEVVARSKTTPAGGQVRKRAAAAPGTRACAPGPSKISRSEGSIITFEFRAARSPTGKPPNPHAKHSSRWKIGSGAISGL